MRGSPVPPPHYAAVLAATVVATQLGAAEGALTRTSVSENYNDLMFLTVSIVALIAVSCVIGFYVGKSCGRDGGNASHKHKGRVGTEIDCGISRQSVRPRSPPSP